MSHIPIFSLRRPAKESSQFLASFRWSAGIYQLKCFRKICYSVMNLWTTVTGFVNTL